MAQANFQPTWAFIKKPSGYPSGPAVGKQELIWRTNYSYLHNRLSPYTDNNSTLFGGFTKEPFYWIGIDDAGKGLSGLKMTEAKFDGRLFPLGSAPIDVIRVAKFLGSGRGIPWLAKQFLLQTGNPYNETRIYNPTSPLVAAGMGLALGSIRPMRHIDISGGLLGIATSLIGSSIPNALGFKAAGIKKPSGTAPKALTDGTYVSTETSGGKGLIRAGTAATAKGALERAWPQTGAGKGNNGSMLSSLLDTAKSIFQNFIPQTQEGIGYRSDEGAYGLMVGGGDQKFSYIGASNKPFGWGQLWMAGAPGADGIRKKSQYPSAAYRVFVKYDNGVLIQNPEKSSTGFLGNISTVGTVGYSVAVSGDKNKPGYRYEDSMGKKKPENQEFQGSDVMYQYKYYADQGQKFPTKDPEAQRTTSTKAKLSAVLDKIKAASEKTYTVSPDANSVLFQQDSVKYNYDRLFKTRNKTDLSPNNFSLGALKAYRYEGVTMVSNELVDNVQKSLKLPTAGTFDAINTLTVLNKDRKVTSSPLKGRWTKWEPYKDDLIALFFYDVVNEKYIPFRAAIKGLSEAGNATWEEMPFIGRADKVYSYGGFNRNANFNLHVVISSIAELAPTWQRINYMAGAIKPSNYTKSNLVMSGTSTTDRFMVPPMFMLTLGDFYRDQPILIQSLTLTVPDDASWETYNEDNVGEGNWAYMANLIEASNVKFGQVPREVEMGFSVVLLEKERAVVGGANFGHAPRDEKFLPWNNEAVPNGGQPNKFNENLVVNVIDSSVTKINRAGQTYSATP